MVTDGVMGGQSMGRLSREVLDGRRALRLQGRVSLENNGGFLQMAVDLAASGSLDARAFSGIALTVQGNGEVYGLHLRTSDLTAPWQSYRQSFTATREWQTLTLPFAGFAPHRTTTPLNLAHLRRLGLIAIGRAFEVDLALADIRLYA